MSAVRKFQPLFTNETAFVVSALWSNSAHQDCQRGRQDRTGGASTHACNLLPAGRGTGRLTALRTQPASPGYVRGALHAGGAHDARFSDGGGLSEMT